MHKHSLLENKVNNCKIRVFILKQGIVFTKRFEITPLVNLFSYH